jgi:hypothetical protein
MSDWTVVKRANRVLPGEKFVFTDEMGGEDEVLTVVSTKSYYGTTELEVEEFDFPILANDTFMVRMAQ